MTTMHITEADGAEHLLVGADVLTIKASSSATAGSMLVFETRVLPGGGPPTLHRHGYLEVFYFLEGAWEVSTLDADDRLQTRNVNQGDTLTIPSMVWHNFKNIGTSHGRFLAIHSPPVMEALLHEIGRPVDDPNNVPAPTGPSSPKERERFMNLIGQYIEMLPPDAIAP